MFLIFVSGCVGSDFNPKENVNQNTAMLNGCLRLREVHNCDINEIRNIKIIGYKESDDESGCITSLEQDCYTLEQVCKRKGHNTLEDCAKACNC